ncbi:MAG: PspA-associated protein PspAA [Acidimicrobiales bacterium]
MIVRILGDRLYEVGDADLPVIESLDSDMDTALSNGDEKAFSTALSELISKVRSNANALPDDDDRRSDLVVPPEGATLQEVRDMLDAGV